MLEQDRFQQSPKLYTIGMVALMLFWLFTLIGSYIVPYLIWDFYYDIPGFVIAWQFYLQEEYELSSQAAKWFTFLTFAIPSVFFMILAWIISNHIDNKIVEQQEMEERTSVPVSEAPNTEPITSRPVGQELSFAVKLIFLMLIALIILFSIEWLISVPPPTS